MDYQAYWDWLNKNAAAVAAMGAVVAAIATAIYAFFTLLLWFATRRQAIFTRQMFEASHRSYVIIRVENPTDISRRDVFSFHMVLENRGTVLAHITKWEVHGLFTDLTDQKLQTFPIFHIDLEHSPFDRALLPGQTKIIEPRF